MRCPTCGGESPSGKRFCADCGGPLAAVCSACGAPLVPGKRFCGDCGTQIGGPVPPAASPIDVRDTAGPAQQTAGQAHQTAGLAQQTAGPAQQSAKRASELRLVSVLFCDLVGFTPFSEQHDAEEVRDVLSGYFELARAIVGRYGGLVEKFIGDAVMAVWGAPVAKEDDAERAVRAGLELVSAVEAYGREHGTELQARVGIVTGNAATTETEEEGLVVGDRVNTAARVQSAAPPGCCYVDETTRTATAAAIAYRDAGEHELKGKAVAMRLYQATRVVATLAGSQRSNILEAPFMGRDRELRLVKELYHSSGERQVARLVLVSGVAGVGKSRLAWEFYKYLDGLAGSVLWHAGRCLSYGEGVSYWALSEIVRSRLLIGEDDPLEVVAEKLRAGLELSVDDAADREFIAPRLGQLLGLPTSRLLAREELFAGWRLFFERLAERLPVVLLIEDLHWADAGLVDFLDHLLEWSGDHAIFLLVLTRPEGIDRKGLVLTRRSVTTLPLDPLPDELIGEIVDGLVRGLPETARARVVERAEGIPLYAIETVRGLLDRGVLERVDDGSLHPLAEVGELEIPPGLTALIASRLDALAPDERVLVKECSVLGSSFPRQAVDAVSDLDPGVLDELLSSLVRKEVLTLRADKLSPEKGHYAFTQSLIRSVAYDLLTRSERKARHLKTAEHLQSAFPDEGAEVAEVIATHFYDAYRAATGDPDADALRARACRSYKLAAERAEAVGAPEAAESAYVLAAGLSNDEAEQAELIQQAGRRAGEAGWNDRAIAHLENALAAHVAAGRVVDAARVISSLASVLQSVGRGELAITRLREALGSLDESTAPAVVADLQNSLGSTLVFAGRGDEAAKPVERALILAQRHALGEPLAHSLDSMATLFNFAGRSEEAAALYERALVVSRRYQLAGAEMRTEGNFADLCMTRDLEGAEEHARSALTLARRWGQRSSEAFAAGNLLYVLSIKGRFEEAVRLGAELFESGGEERAGAEFLHFELANIEAIRGNSGGARHHLSMCGAESDDVQYRAVRAAIDAAVLLAEGDARHALEVARHSIDESIDGGLGITHSAVRQAFPVAVEAAIALGDIEEADRLASWMAARPAGEVPPYLGAQLIRTRALIAGARGATEGPGEELALAEATFRELGYQYWTARAELDRAELLARQGRLDTSTALASSAAATFASVGAAPMLARARALLEAYADRAISAPSPA